MAQTTKCTMCGCIHIVPMFDEDESEMLTCMACKGRFVVVRGAKTPEGHWPSRIHRSMVREDNPAQ